MFKVRAGNPWAIEEGSSAKEVKDFFTECPEFD